MSNQSEWMEERIEAWRIKLAHICFGEAAFSEMGEALRSLAKEVRIATLREAAGLVCNYCGGREPSAVRIPYKPTESYVPNYGEIGEGEWIHRTDWGGHLCCYASPIWQSKASELEKL